MVSLSTLTVYIPAVLFMVLTPGPAILFTLNRSLSSGRRAGFVTVAGLLSGSCVLFVGAALGLTVLLQASTLASAALKIAGARSTSVTWESAQSWRRRSICRISNGPGRTLHRAGITSEG